jgi:hypothetical protein
MKPIEPTNPLEFKESPRWWPDDLGEPTATGGQNGMQYAYFRKARRLLVRRGDATESYDVEPVDLRGIFQDGDAADTTFSSSEGVIPFSQLKRSGPSS